MKLKNDKYKRVRGGESRLLQISGQKCGAQLCHYQKDGPGGLLRMYLDRISEPEVSLERKDLACPQGHLVGVRIVYKKEDRPAFRLVPDAIIKKIPKP